MKPFRLICNSNYHECKGLGSIFIANEIFIDKLDGECLRITINENGDIDAFIVKEIPKSRPRTKEDIKLEMNFEKIAKMNPL